MVPASGRHLERRALKGRASQGAAIVQRQHELRAVHRQPGLGGGYGRLRPNQQQPSS